MKNPVKKGLELNDVYFQCDLKKWEYGGHYYIYSKEGYIDYNPESETGHVLCIYSGVVVGTAIGWSVNKDRDVTSPYIQILNYYTEYFSEQEFDRSSFKYITKEEFETKFNETLSKVKEQFDIMNKEELIKHIQEKATTVDLIKVADVLNIEIDKPSNINGKYFYREDDYSEDYVKVIDSEYDSNYDNYVIAKCIFISEDDIALCEYIDPIDLMEDKEISKEEFMRKYNEVLSKIHENL